GSLRREVGPGQRGVGDEAHGDGCALLSRGSGGDTAGWQDRDHADQAQGGENERPKARHVILPGKTARAVYHGARQGERGALTDMAASEGRRDSPLQPTSGPVAGL